MAGLSKRLKRVLLILVAAVILAVGGAGAYVMRQGTLDHRAIDARDAGRAALAKGDWRGALDGIGRYLQRYADRGAPAEDYVSFARARRHVELPNGKHIAAAIAHLQKAVALDPSSVDARSDLVELYLQSGYLTEAVETIDSLLVTKPGDAALLRTKFDVLETLRQFPKALEVAKQLNAAAPQDLAGHFRTLRSLINSNASHDDVDHWIEKVLSARANEPKFELLRAYSASQSHDTQELGKVLDHVLASSANTTDPEFVALLVGLLDDAGRFDDSLRTLERYQTVADVPLQRELVRRLWYAGRESEIAACAEHWGDSPIKSDPEVLALLAVSLLDGGRRADCDAVVKTLAARTDPEGKAWSAFLEFRVATDQTAHRRSSADALAEAVKVIPTSAVLRQALGSALAALGEGDLAIDAWTQASVRAPAWGRPLRDIAVTLLRTPGRESLAFTTARAAWTRAPNDPLTISTLVEAIAANPAEADPSQRAKLLAAMDTVARDTPDQAADMVPLQIEMIAAWDKADVERRLKSVLSSKTPTSESTLIRLAQLSDRRGFGLSTDFLNLSETAYGVTPQLALAKALARSSAGESQAGLRLLDDLRARAKAGTSPRDWEIVRANYLDASGHPDAAAAWISLADAHADALEIQLGALASTAAWSDRDAVARITERVHQLTGDRATAWRIARARWLMDSPSGSQSEAAEAAEVLTEVARDAPKSLSARVLLARALERLGNLSGADAQLQLATDISPTNSWIQLERARLAQKRGMADVARQQLDRALAYPDLGSDLSERAAYLLAAQGDSRRGVGLLEPIVAKSQAKREGVMLLARLYAHIGQSDRAIQICERLFSRLDSRLVDLGADLYAAAGRRADAEALITRFAGMDNPPGETELTRARFAAKWGPPEAAAESFRRALSLSPSRADVWSAYIAFAIARGDAATLSGLLEDPRGASVDVVQYLAANRSACVGAMGDVRLRPLVLAAMDPTEYRATLLEAVRLVHDDWGDPSKRPNVVRTVRGLADSNARALPLQLLAAELCADLGDVRVGSDIARRAMVAFPSSVAAARQAAEMLARCDRWADAVEAGTGWLQRSGAQDRAASVFVAQAMLRSEHPAEAASSLETLARASIASREPDEPLVLTYVVALVRSGRVKDASGVLADLSGRIERWRDVPIGVPPEWLGDAESAQAWLNTVAGIVPAADVPRRLALARAWGRAWERFRTPSLLDGAKQVLAPILAAADSPAEANFVAATLAQQAGDADAARRQYVAALEKDGGFVLARNNLAVLLADSGEWQRAVDEAAKIVAAAPKSAEFYDTLAYAQRKGKEFGPAEASLRTAIALQPANLAWQVSLAEVLTDGGRPKDAEQVLRTIDERIAAGGQVAPELRTRIDRLQGNRR